MAKAKFGRTRPHCNIGTIGHANHNRTTLTATITRVLTTRLSSDMNEIVDFENIDKAPGERERGTTINTTHVGYETEARHYTHVDCPGHADCIKNMIIDTVRMDGAILVVTITDGVMAQARGHILPARRVSIPYIAVFMNKYDTVDDEELLDLVEMETRELLDDHDFPGNDVSIIRGFTLKALEDPNGPWDDRIIDLMNAVDEAIPEPEHESDKPFLMPVKNALTITDYSTIVTGRVERNTLRLNDKVELVDIRDKGRKIVVTGIEMFRKLLDYAEAGDNIDLFLCGVNRESILCDQALAKPGTVTCHARFATRIYVLVKNKNGCHTPSFNNYRPQFYFRTTNVASICALPKGTEVYMPDNSVEMTVKLIRPVAMEQGLRPAIRKDGRTVGPGRVAKVVE